MRAREIWSEMLIQRFVDFDTNYRASSGRLVMAKKENSVHFTFANDFAPYFLLVFSPVFALTCFFGVFYTYLTTEV